MRQQRIEDIWDAHTGHEAAIVSFVAAMQARGLTPAEVLAAYERRMDELQAAMLPPPDAPVSAPDTRRQEGQADVEYRLGACPRCGADVWGIKKCPHISPPWRTFLACDNESCGFHGRSRLAVEALLRQWPDGVEED